MKRIMFVMALSMSSICGFGQLIQIERVQAPKEDVGGAPFFL